MTPFRHFGALLLCCFSAHALADCRLMLSGLARVEAQTPFSQWLRGASSSI